MGLWIGLWRYWKGIERGFRE